MTGLTTNERLLKIKLALQELSDSDMVQVHNEFCDKMKYYEDMIYPTTLLDMNCDGMSPSEIINKYAQVNTSDHWYIDDGYSFNNYQSGRPMYEDIAIYIERNDDCLGNDDIAEVLEELEQQQTNYELACIVDEGGSYDTTICILNGDELIKVNVDEKTVMLENVDVDNPFPDLINNAENIEYIAPWLMTDLKTKKN